MNFAPSPTVMNDDELRERHNADDQAKVKTVPIQLSISVRGIRR